MSKTRIERLGVGAAAGVALAVSLSAQGQINYGDFLGTGTDPDILGVTENSTTDGLPLFGAPVRVGNSLLFFPTGFASDSADGSSDTTAGTLSLFIEAQPGQFLSTITIREFGDFQLTGVGTAATSATVSGAAFVTDLDTLTIFSDTIDVTPSSPVELPGDSSGSFEGVTFIDLTGQGVTSAQLQFNNILSTTSEDGTTAFIQKQVVSGPAIVIEVPSPGVGAVGAVAGLFVMGRRRRG